MNMRHTFLFIFLLTILFGSTACERFIDLSELGHQINTEDSPVLLGAVVAGSPLRIYASSIQETPNSAATIRKMTLRRADGREITLGADKNHYFTSIEKLTAGEFFTLTAIPTTGNELVISKQIPAAVQLQTSMRNLTDELEVEAMLSSADQEKYYVLEIHRIENGKDQLLRFACDSPETDNARYNELSSNAERLFLHTKNDRSLLRLRIYRPYLYGDVYLRVQSVDAAYYQYLYNYEAQKHNDKALIEMPRSKGYLGVIGAASEASEMLPDEN